ncbi:adenylate kinase [[Leptolyngbya] sp. PCC 7376]|uniref:adenylate kinase n=1 Tax=[Leptolyngbya] sp. PCC 7376 TaxID=111781 RepID=UPI0021F8E6B8|nr:adenylate kinase [[Leptolyngbya] sp. PCC 7376]
MGESRKNFHRFSSSDFIETLLDGSVMMRLVLLGGPGAGKSTQSRFLCEKFQLQRVSVGDILRQAIADQTDLGKQAESYVNQGKLIPDPLIIEFMRDRLTRPDMVNGWVLEGYPRTAFQAEELDFLLDDLSQTLNKAIYFKVDEQVLSERSQARGLTDDTPEAIRERLKAFRESTEPILDYYSPRQKLLTVDAGQAIEAVSAELLSGLQ